MMYSNFNQNKKLNCETIAFYTSDVYSHIWFPGNTSSQSGKHLVNEYTEVPTAYLR